MDSTGLIRVPLVAEARRIVFRSTEPAALRDQLRTLAQIDQAHVLMLIDCNIIAVRDGRDILSAIAQLVAGDFAELGTGDPIRGLYLAYETALVARCPAAADVHVARSRNDINATVFALSCRQEVAGLIRETVRLVASIGNSIARAGAVEMPVFSHRRPGMPGTWELYLSAIAATVLRDAEGLLLVLDHLGVSPLGAGAGAGSSMPIDAARTAKLLGFTGAAPNALAAVAGRDAGLRALASAAILASNLGRLATDLQGWYAEHDAIALPDDLVGSSSMMPQKRNAFLLEHVLGKAGRTSGALAGALAACQGAPFANAVQVGTEAAAAILEGLTLAQQAATLAAIMIDGARPVARRFDEMNRTGAVAATALALELRRQRGIGFRDAHHSVGSALRAAGSGDPVGEAASALGLSASALGRAAAMTHGGGAGAAAARLRSDERKASARACRARLAQHARRWHRADRELETAVRRALDRKDDLP
jgi:argininosuccinate lyase